MFQIKCKNGIDGAIFEPVTEFAGKVEPSDPATTSNMGEEKVINDLDLTGASHITIQVEVNTLTKDDLNKGNKSDEKRKILNAKHEIISFLEEEQQKEQEQQQQQQQEGEEQEQEQEEEEEQQQQQEGGEQQEQQKEKETGRTATQDASGLSETVDRITQSRVKQEEVKIDMPLTEEQHGCAKQEIDFSPKDLLCFAWQIARGMVSAEKYKKFHSFAALTTREILFFAIKTQNVSLLRG